MSRRSAQYLYLYEPLEVEVDAVEVPAAATMTLKLCASNRGDPAAIDAGVSVTVSAVDGTFTCLISSAALLAALGSSHSGKPVWGFLYDDAGSFRDVYEFRVTDVDPDLLPALTT